MHWHVLEIIEPDIAEASPARTDRYILLVDGPFACLKGSEGEQCTPRPAAAAVVDRAEHRS
jgi:hypothetical protein